MTTSEIPRSKTAESAADLATELLSQPWVGELLTELAERQRGSTELAGRAGALASSSHAFLPFHAPQFPPAVVRAEGSRITDVDGNTYLDMHVGFGGQSLFGHNPRPVLDAVREELTSGNTGNGYLNRVEPELAELLGEFLPHCEKFAFLNSGTDATGAAIRLARAHTGRQLVAKFEGCWHGVHDVAAHNTSFLAHGTPGLAPFPAVRDDGSVRPASAFAGAAPADVLVLPHHAPTALALIERHRHELACVIADPACQSFPYTEHTIPELREVSERCRTLNVPFVLDEVLTGFRFGPGGAAARFGLHADLIAYGKVTSGLGLSLAVLGGRAELLDIMRTSGLSAGDIGTKTFLVNTHSGNHLALAASLASLRLLKEAGPAFYGRINAKAGRLQGALAGFRERTGIPLRLLGFGEYCGTFGFVAEESYADYREFASAVNALGSFLLTLLLRRRGVFTLSMPMIYLGDAHSEADIDELTAAVTGSAQELETHGFPFVLP
ncbi:aminotransferase class III-fold pyridoxal phosphate-dependent enzyme [Streptomyces sp. NBC_01187]|uniref:aminotransferase class III-fold pyridoxal phosphate-dependent enzyme n=1 Tax=Streptomyces sp. NBC_01187 TaxID=2903766 RepID=UPI00386D16FD|nr:aminotransferase class III-fold pyridoxal phosphate-dependent enzyme [Streptomyces sp. NBC_01187]